MLRLDPGEGRIHTTRSFRAWEGGGEYNVAAALRALLRPAHRDRHGARRQPGEPPGRGSHAAGRRRPLVLALAEVRRRGARSAERSQLHRARLRPRGGVGCSDRGHTAVFAPTCKPGDVDWRELFGRPGRAGSTPAGCSPRSSSTPEVARARHGRCPRGRTRISHDLNYRDSLWRSFGGPSGPKEVNRSLAPFVDVLLGNEEDFSAALGFNLEGVDEELQGAPDRELQAHDRDEVRLALTRTSTTVATARARTARFGERQRLESMLATTRVEFYEVPAARRRDHGPCRRRGLLSPPASS